jgi:eukaryotic-like serine/threonine-protein kinase
MSISTTDSVLPPADELIELEPSMQLDLGGSPLAGSPGAPLAALASPEGSLASLAGETDTLRRRRLLAASVFLAATYGVLTVWVFASDNPATFGEDGGRLSTRVVLLGLRCLLATAVAGLLASEVPLSRKPLRAVELVLFLGLTLLVMASQYFINLDLAHRGPQYTPMILALIKDGVIQMLVMMMIYGTLIPNAPAVAARMLTAMFLGPIAVLVLLGMQAGAGPIVEQLQEAEESGSNILFLAIGASLALYGSFLVNGLRTQLHRARKMGQYQLIRKLGEGGMGEVYLAEHHLLKRPCALKRIKLEAGDDAIAIARFEREVQAAARLNHPNTIEIYDYGLSEDGTFYYVMEYLEGLSLSDLVHLAGPLPAGRVVHLFRQVCAGLAEAHSLGLVHRDLKPANVFVAIRGAESDVAKILDFGLVKITGDPSVASLTGEMTVSGTPLYMAPEQATADRSLDARADIYAMGAMMYFCLTGRPPFTGDSAFAIMIANARDPVVPPSLVCPGVPHDLEDVVLRCLAKAPADRFPTARALGEALAACRSAADWGPNRADAWWAAQEHPAPVDPTPQPAAAG